MKQLTIRGVGEKVHMAIKDQADRKGMSVNRYVRSILREAVGLGSERSSQNTYHDLDHLAGTWTQQELEAFEMSLSPLRKIDQDLWG